MKMNKWNLFWLLFLFQSNTSLSAEPFNVAIMPDSINSFKCHQPGVEFKISQTSSLGVFGTLDCKSNRSTYGDTNNDVTNTFSRIFFPWRYSKGGVFKTGSFMQALIGIEKSKFKSVLGSKADVTFVDFAFHYGYQWFWENGFNVSVLGGLAYLVKTNSDKSISANETDDVKNFLDKNTKTNIHPGAGVVIGWKF